MMRELPRHIDPSVKGTCSPEFGAVLEAFRRNLDEGLEIGASFAVFRFGRPVVDLWGGHHDQKGATLLPKDALFNIWSSTKGLAAGCMALLVDRNQLDYGAPVAEYWPEFAQAGKADVTVGQLLSHQAGLCSVREPVSIEDYYAHDRIASLLAAQKPYFPPGSGWGYHPQTLGTLMDELVRRVDGRRIADFFAEELAGPLGLDAYLGLPLDQDGRQVPVYPDTRQAPPADQATTPEILRDVVENPGLDPQWPNTRAWRSAGLAATGGSANARSLAMFYGILANGGRYEERPFLSPGTIAEATRERVAGIDHVSGEYGRYAAGFRLNDHGKMGPNAESFGHAGWGGIVAFADPAHGLGIAYVANRMNTSDQVDVRSRRLLDALYASL